MENEKYRIIKTFVCNYSDHFDREFISRMVGEDSVVYEVHKLEKKGLFFKKEVWVYINCYTSLERAKEAVLKMKGEHPDQLKIKELKNQLPEVVYKE